MSERMRGHQKLRRLRQEVEALYPDLTHQDSRLTRREREAYRRYIAQRRKRAETWEPMPRSWMD